MALVNIDYGVGMDNMQGVFDKTNLAIDKINEIDNWQIADKTAIFSGLTDSDATKSSGIYEANALYNNNLVILTVDMFYVSLLETGGGENGASFPFNPAFQPVGNLIYLEDIISYVNDISNPSTISPKIVRFNISDSSPLGAFGSERLWFYGDTIGGGGNEGFRVNKTFAYKLI